DAQPGLRGHQGLDPRTRARCAARDHAPARRTALHHPQRRQHAPGDPARAVERDERRTVLPHPSPVPPVAAARRSGDADRAPGGERVARRAQLQRAGLGRGEGARVVRARNGAGQRPAAVAERAGAAAYGRWLPAAAVAHQPHAGRRALPAPGDPHAA
ncbi:hypothetical protein OY671_011697, partial [Metschnikowia pulcherrima]